REFNFDGAGLLTWNGLPLTEIIWKHGTPLRIMYLPKIGEKIDQARAFFANALKEHGYNGTYDYFYCTKSNQFSYVVGEVLKKGVSLETSSAYDNDIIERLMGAGKMPETSTILCNGYKDGRYIRNIGRLKNR